MSENFEDKDQLRIQFQERFNEFFPDAKIEPSDFENISQTARDHFIEIVKNRESGETYQPEELNEAYKIIHTDEDETYVTRIKSEESEKVYLVNIRGEESTGAGGFSYSPISEKAVDAGVETRKKFQRQQLAVKSLEIMNALAQMFYKVPLHSNMARTVQGKGVWEKLVMLGKVTKFQEGHYDQYVFKDKQSE